MGATTAGLVWPQRRKMRGPPRCGCLAAGAQIGSTRDNRHCGSRRLSAGAVGGLCYLATDPGGGPRRPSRRPYRRSRTHALSWTMRHRLEFNLPHRHCIRIVDPISGPAMRRSIILIALAVTAGPAFAHETGLADEVRGLETISSKSCSPACWRSIWSGFRQCCCASLENGRSASSRSHPSSQPCLFS